MAEHAARLALLLLASVAVSAQAPADDTPSGGEAAGGTLVVAVHPAPPFAEAGTGGVWDGLGVALATDLGQHLGRGVRFVEVSRDSALAAVVAGRADLALVTMTPAGEAAADYTAPFYSARLGVARPTGSRLLDVAGRLLSPSFFKVALGLALLLLVVGTAVWALERHENGDEFSESARSGIWDGFWWSGVTMTTIGYGDKSPKTVPGRSLALVWMLVSMVVTASLTASLVSATGASDGDAQLPEDLQGKRVGVVAGSAAQAILAEARVDARAFPTVDAGLAAVEADSLDAFVDAAPRLRAGRAAGADLRVLTTGAEFERWAFAVAQGSPLRDAVSQAVLDRVQTADWPATVRRYVGSD